MGKKIYLRAILYLGIAIIVVYVISLIIFPEWRNKPWGFLVLIGGVILAVVGVANNFLSYLDRFRNLPRGEEAEFPLSAITPEELIARLSRGGQVNWMNRGTTNVTNLRKNGRIIIKGRMKLGKTREAIELIRRAINEDLIPKNRVFEPATHFNSLAKEGIRDSIHKKLNPHMPILLFVDDLPKHYSSTNDLERLEGALAGIKICSESYVIATGRSDQFGDIHDQWMKSNHFQVISLSELNKEQTRRLIDAAAGTFGLQVDDNARKTFTDEGDGTPELILISFRRLRAEKIHQIDETIARKYSEESSSIAWAEAWRDIIEKIPESEILREAMATFHASGARPHTKFVIEYANHLRKKIDQKKLLLRRKTAFQNAFKYLAHFDIIDNKGLIVYPDIALEGMIADAEAKEKLGNFLTNHKRLFQNRVLRGAYKESEQHAWIIFDLAMEAQERNDSGWTIHLYSAAIRVRPHFGYFNNRGNAYYKQGDLKQAIADYDQAIQLNPQYATAYRNRAESLIRIGRFEEAEADCKEAEKLTKNHPYTHARWGQLHNARGEYEASIERYQKAGLLSKEASEFNFDIGLPLICLGRAEEALDGIRERLKAKPRIPEINTALRDYEDLKTSQPKLEGVEEAINILRSALKND